MLTPQRNRGMIERRNPGSHSSRQLSTSKAQDTAGASLLVLASYGGKMRLTVAELRRLHCDAFADGGRSAGFGPVATDGDGFIR